MSVTTFQDSEKKITLPSEIHFDNGEVLPIDDVQVRTVVDDERNIIALNLIAELDNGGTVTNHITFHSFNDVGSDAGLYDEDPDDYEHPIDDCSYDTIVPLSEVTLETVRVEFK